MTSGAKWSWVLYPIIVVVFILVSANYILANKDRWTQIVLGEQEKTEIEGQIAQLREKLAVLERVNVERDTDDLKVMARAVLPNPAIWFTATELRDAASSSGVLITRYQAAGVGDVKEGDLEASPSGTIAPALPMSLAANMRAADLEAIQLLVKQLEEQRPLVKVSKINYQFGVISMTVDGAWEPWVGAAAQTLAVPLSEYRSQVEETKKRLAEFNEYPTIDRDDLELVEIPPNPF